MSTEALWKLGVILVGLEIGCVRGREGKADFQSRKLQKVHRWEIMVHGGILRNSVLLETFRGFCDGKKESGD